MPEKEIKPTIIGTFEDDSILVDTIIQEHKTAFIIFNKDTREYYIRSELERGEIKYVPIEITSPFIKSGSILLPSDLCEYGTKQELLKSISNFISKYVDIPKEYIILASYYVLLTYVYNNFSEIPYLRVIGDYGSGKSRLLKTIGSICYTPMMTNGGTTLSAIFRMIELFKGTLVIDEADMSFSDTNNPMIKLYNNGYQKGQPIMRADGVGFEVNCYEVYCPKMIGGRMEFKDKATESRCLTNIMKKSDRKDIPISITQDFYDEAQALRNKLIKFRYDYYDKIIIENNSIDGLEPRLNQIINPILSLIDKDSTKEVVINFLKSKQKDIIEERRQSIFGVILNIIHNKFKDSPEIYYHDIIDTLEIVEGVRNNINNRKLGSILKQNRLKGMRKSDGTVLVYEDNKDEIERLFKEYGII